MPSAVTLLHRRGLVGLSSHVACDALWCACQQGDISTLGRSEQYIRIISSVPRLKHRLELLLFKQQFPDITKRLEQSIHSVEQVNVAILHRLVVDVVEC